MNAEAVSVIFDGSTDIVNGEVAVESEIAYNVVTDGEEVSVTIDGSDAIVNGETVSEPVPSAAVSEGKLVSEAVVPTTVEVNDESLGATFDGTVSLVDFHPVIATNLVTVYNQLCMLLT